MSDLPPAPLPQPVSARAAEEEPKKGKKGKKDKTSKKKKKEDKRKSKMIETFAMPEPPKDPLRMEEFFGQVFFPRIIGKLKLLD